VVRKLASQPISGRRQGRKWIILSWPDGLIFFFQ